MTADQAVKVKNLLYSGMTPDQKEFLVIPDDCRFFLLEELFKHKCKINKFTTLSLTTAFSYATLPSRKKATLV